VASSGPGAAHRLRPAVEVGLTADRSTDGLVEMAWDPITRIVGSLGIYTKIDFAERRVAECKSTSSIFRGYAIFMQGKDPRDAHFITSRICGICGDNHATCSVYAQNMAYGVRPPHLAEWIINLGEAAEYMFDHCIFQENLVGVDFCEKMVAETNPGVLARAERTEAPHAGVHGFRTIADIMRSLNPFEGSFYKEALQMSRLTREMFCLMEGRHVHPSTLYPGGVGTVATVQLFTDYLVRLMRYVEFMKRVVPMHDDLFDFFYEALPGYEEVGRRRVMLGCWGSFQDPDHCTFDYRDMSEWGRKMFVSPGIVVDGELRTTDLVDINLGIRILLGSSYYDDWVGRDVFVSRDPLGNPVDPRHPWNQHTVPKPQKRDLDGGNYSWVMSPRWFDGTDHLALDTGGGPLARLWATALAGLVDNGYVRSTGQSVEINLPRTANAPETQLEWRIPQWSNTLERNRARSYFQAYAAASALYFVDRALAEVRAGHTKTWEPFTVPDHGIGVGFTEAVRGLLSHHLVIEGGKIANYHPYPPTPWNASPRDEYGTPGPYEDAIEGSPIFEENGPDDFRGIDIMRTVRSFDPCLPCGVHMYVGGGRVIEKRHSPTMLNTPHG
jgi:hydrogenase large subunit